MSCRIRILEEQTKSQIAAGQIVEQPASVVKELIENAIDAEATEILVEILGGGLQRIRIRDNGYGMNREELPLAFARHATSKISSVEDLENLHSMGFRGEALPSIASISKCHISTCARGEEALSLTLEGGVITQAPCPTSHPIGTTIEVDSLFYNLPVKKNFQRSPSYHVGEIHRTLIWQALAHPEISFRFINQEREQLAVTGFRESSLLEALQERAESLLGEAFLINSFPFEHSEEGGKVRILGYLGSPEHGQKSRRGQYFFLNRRPVKLPFLSTLLQDIYATCLARYFHPTFLIHLFLPSPWVDVNVHPQKWEVRLKESGKIRRIVHAVVEKTLGFSPLSFSEPSPPFERESFSPPHSSLPSFSPSPKAFSLRETELSLPLAGHIESVGFLPPHLLLLSQEAFFPDQITAEELPGLLLVDLRVVEARLLWEMQQLHSVSEIDKKERQLSIYFEKVPFLPIEWERVRPHRSFLRKLGIELTEQGEVGWEASYRKREFLSLEEIKEWIFDCLLLREEVGETLLLEEENRRQKSSRLYRLCFKKKKRTKEQGEAMVTVLNRLEDPLFSPIGRVTMHLLSLRELEKKMLASPTNWPL